MASGADNDGADNGHGASDQGIDDEEELESDSDNSSEDDSDASTCVPPEHSDTITEQHIVIGNQDLSAESEDLESG